VSIEDIFDPAGRGNYVADSLPAPLWRRCAGALPSPSGASACSVSLRYEVQQSSK